ncbi:hypothetical protein ACIBI9_00350 [Nonomuraea sp. NPDC050451]|uniref:hypothetical protein n=1 Tax=Nonomuraea sp. NPDC050451 TaxID=3364364 RepID=UPI0037A76C26
MRVGIAHHFGWAVTVTASADHQVVDRRRIELIEPGVPAAPIHHEGRRLDDAAASEIAVQRRVPYESRADSVMYRQILAELAHARGWAVHFYDARDVEDQAAGILAERAGEVLYGPRAVLGPPWTKDHRTALAATIVAAAPRPGLG